LASIFPLIYDLLEFNSVTRGAVVLFLISISPSLRYFF